MKCLASFKCNGIRGSAGKLLTEEELDSIGGWLPILIAQGLVEAESVESEQLEPIDQLDLEVEKKPKKRRKKDV